MNMHADMSSTIIARSDQINAADLIGNPRTIVIREVRIKAGDDQPVSVLVEGDNKAFRPCKGVRRLMVRVWGADATKYVGQAMTLFCDPSVTWAGKEEGGIRVSHMTGLSAKIVEFMRFNRAGTKPYEILPLKIEREPAAITAQDVRGWIMAAQTLEDLGAVWKRRDVAPFRDELTEVKDARKTALENPETGRADTQALTEALAEIEKATDPDRINKAVQVTLRSLSDDEGQVLRDAATGRIEILEEGK